MSDPPPSLRSTLEADAARVDEALQRLLASPEDGAAFAQLEAALLAHIALVDRTFVVEIQRQSERDARVLSAEHRHLRQRLDEIRRDRRPATLRAFVDEVRAHARNETRIVRRCFG